MAIFDPTKDGYQLIGEGDQSTSPSSQTFLSLNVSSMTVNDIKKYIDALTNEAGWLTPDQLTKVINDIAKSSGFLSPPEIQNIVKTS